MVLSAIPDICIEGISICIAVTDIFAKCLFITWDQAIGLKLDPHYGNRWGPGEADHITFYQNVGILLI